MKVDTSIWITRDGRKIPIKEMEESHFHNLVYYIITEISLGNNFLKRYLPVISSQCFKRKISVQSIMDSGPKSYKNSQGLEVLWDEETNRDLPIN